MKTWLCLSHKSERALEEGKSIRAKCTRNKESARVFVYEQLQLGRVILVKCRETGSFKVYGKECLNQTVDLPE